MAAAANSKIFLTIKRPPQSVTCYCSIYGKKLEKFVKRTENPLACWACLIVGVDS